MEDELLGLKLTYYDNYLLTEVRAISELVVVDLVVEAPIVLLGLCRVLLGLLERREFEWRKTRSIKLGLGVVCQLIALRYGPLQSQLLVKVKALDRSEFCRRCGLSACICALHIKLQHVLAGRRHIQWRVAVSGHLDLFLSEIASGATVYGGQKSVCVGSLVLIIGSGPKALNWMSEYCLT